MSVGITVGVIVGVGVYQALLKVSQASWVILRCLPSGPIQSIVDVTGWLEVEVFDRPVSVPDDSDWVGTGLSVGVISSVGCGVAVGVTVDLPDLLVVL